MTNAIHETGKQHLKNVFNEWDFRFERRVLNDGRYVEVE
jgi:hypothetical protein